MSIALITGSSGLIGSESVRFFAKKKFDIVGIDNDFRAKFFGKNASTKWNENLLKREIKNFKSYNIDIRKKNSLSKIFQKYSDDIKIIIHTAAQPSHDWAAKDPILDFEVNALGTINLLELTRQYCPKATFVFTSTNKVYGDLPNELPLVEQETRFELINHKFSRNGIDESMSIDNSTHSVFGASKVSADVMTQEYGKYFNLKTGIFRGGCLTGPNHSGTELHGFLSYLVKANISKIPYTIFGYKGKQVRDNIHSYDLVNMFWHFHKNPKNGEVYNAGGGRYSNCSMIEAIHYIEKKSNIKMNYNVVEKNRIGDHIWYISDVSKFKSHYPDWNYKYNIENIIDEIVASQLK